MHSTPIKRKSQCTYRCVVLPDSRPTKTARASPPPSQCTYRCVVLPDLRRCSPGYVRPGLNAPTGAWCSLTRGHHHKGGGAGRLNAPTGAWCSLTRDMLARLLGEKSLNAPTGAWCSLTRKKSYLLLDSSRSQCTYRCVVLPDPCPRERRYDATSRARSATGPGSTPPDRPAPGPE